MRSFVFYCCTPHLNRINLYIVLVCHKILFGIVIGEQVFGEQMSLGSKCHWGASVAGEQLSREQLSGEQDSGYQFI
jgi:hypothetical protein